LLSESDFPPVFLKGEKSKMTTQNHEAKNQIKGEFKEQSTIIETAKKAEKKDNRLVVAYARTSTQMQEKGLESQIRAIREYCKQNGITDYLLYSDEGISGTKNSRPALDKMMNAVREGKVSKVIVYSFSRYARSTSHLLNALKEFKKMNVEFSSISERQLGTEQEKTLYCFRKSYSVPRVP